MRYSPNCLVSTPRPRIVQFADWHTRHPWPSGGKRGAAEPLVRLTAPTCDQDTLGPIAASRWDTGCPKEAQYPLTIGTRTAMSLAAPSRRPTDRWFDERIFGRQPWIKSTYIDLNVNVGPTTPGTAFTVCVLFGIHLPDRSRSHRSAWGRDFPFADIGKSRSLKSPDRRVRRRESVSSRPSSRRWRQQLFCQRADIGRQSIDAAGCTSIRMATPHFHLRLNCSECRLIRDQSGPSTYPGTVDMPSTLRYKVSKPLR
jgi:hypothetical protein